MSRASLEKKPAEVASMFDQVAARYDLMNDVMTVGINRYWRRATLAALDAKPGELVLDIAAGTGASSMPLHERGVDVIAADFSLGMLREGRRRFPTLPFAAADATRLPFADDTFDAVTMSYGLRNVSEYAVALREFARVTKPGGRLVISEFSQPTSGPARRFYTEWLMAAIPPVARRVSSNPDSYVYLAESIQAWPAQEALARTIRESGWGDVQWRNLAGGILALHRAVKPGAAEEAR